MVKGFAVVIRSDFRGRNLPAKKQIKHKKNHNRAQNFSLFEISFLPYRSRGLDRQTARFPDNRGCGLVKW